MKKNFFWANMIRGIGLCLILCPMAMCFAFSWYHINWLIYLIVIGVATYLAGKIYVMEFDNRRVSTATYNATAIAAAVLTIIPMFFSAKLPYYLTTMNLYSALGALFLIASLFLRPNVDKTSSEYVHYTGVKLQAVLNEDSPGILVHPALTKKLDAKAGDPIEVVGGYMGSRYTTGELSVGTEALEEDKVYLDKPHFQALSLKNNATVKVCYYRPVETSSSVEEAVQLAIGHNNNVAS